MKDSTSTLQRPEQILANPDRGVLGLVEEILDAARHQDIQLDWEGGRLRLMVIEGEEERRIEALLAKSVVRAILARVAALCNESRPGSVSPYGGEGVVAIDADPPSMIRAKFVNVAGNQHLELKSKSSEVVSLAVHDHAESS